jgi:hypothetical protein
VNLNQQKLPSAKLHTVEENRGTTHEICIALKCLKKHFGDHSCLSMGIDAGAGPWYLLVADAAEVVDNVHARPAVLLQVGGLGQRVRLLHVAPEPRAERLTTHQARPLAPVVPGRANAAAATPSSASLFSLRVVLYVVQLLLLLLLLRQW